MVDISHALEKIALHRDRFNAWGLVISALAIVAAIWSSAPTLEIDLPLTGGAKANLNVGYVLAFGPLVIFISLAWAIGALASMRRYQQAVVSEVQISNGMFSPSELLTLTGPLGDGYLGAGFIHTVGATSFMRRARVFFFFIIPVISQIVINSNSFDNLRTYKEKSVVTNISDLLNSKIKSGTPLKIGDFPFLKEKITTIDFLTKNDLGRNIRYILENRSLERECANKFFLKYLKSLDKKEKKLSKIEDLLDKDEPTCIAEEFPRFELALNTWVNIVVTIFTIMLGVLGSRLYLSKDIHQFIFFNSLIEEKYKPRATKNKKNFVQFLVGLARKYINKNT